MTNPPISNDTALVSFTILIDGKQIPDSIEITAINIHQQLGEVDQAEFACRLGIPGNEIDSFDTFKLDSNVEIKLGYHSKEERVFRGNISFLRTTADSEIAPTLWVICESSEERKATAKDGLPSPEYHLKFGQDLLSVDLVFGKFEEPYILSSVRGSMLILGAENLEVNTLLSLDGFSDVRFNGDVRISGIAHSLAEGQWTTEIEIG